MMYSSGIKECERNDFFFFFNNEWGNSFLLPLSSSSSCSFFLWSCQTCSALLLRQLSVFVPAARVGLSIKNNKKDNQLINAWWLSLNTRRFSSCTNTWLLVLQLALSVHKNSALWWLVFVCVRAHANWLKVGVEMGVAFCKKVHDFQIASQTCTFSDRLAMSQRTAHWLLRPTGKKGAWQWEWPVTKKST